MKMDGAISKCSQLDSTILDDELFTILKDQLFSSLKYFKVTNN